MATCLITGAGRGIGRATAVELSKRGYYDKIALISRNKDELEETSKMMHKGNCQSYTYCFDISQLDKIEEFIYNIHHDMPTIESLINLAGNSEIRSLAEIDATALTSTFNVNVLSPILITKEVVKYMRLNSVKGKIVNVASTLGINPRPGWLCYGSAKAALIMSSRVLSEELAADGIKIYCVSPGRCATAMRKKIFPEEDPTNLMPPEEVALLIANLLSEQGNCIDGQNIVIREQKCYVNASKSGN